MKRNTKKKKDFVVFLFLDLRATATASSVVTLSAQIKIWYDIFFLLILSYYFILSLFCTAKKNTPIVWRLTYKHIQILWYYSFSWHFVVCFFFFSSFDGVLLSCGYDLSLSFLCASGAARVGGISSRQSAYFVPACERNGNVLSKTKFIDVYIFPFFLSVRMFLLVSRSRSSLGPMCWFFFLLLDSIHNFALRLYKHSNLSFHCVQQFNHSIRFISLNCDRERINWSNQKMKTNTLLEWALLACFILSALSVFYVRHCFDCRTANVKECRQPFLTKLKCHS